MTWLMNDLYQHDKIQSALFECLPNGEVHKPISHYDGTILQSLLHSIVSMLVFASLSQHCELLVQITLNEGEETKNGREDVRHERLDDCGEGSGDTNSMSAIVERGALTRILHQTDCYFEHVVA